MEELIRKLFTGKKVAILGMGREGRSTYNLIRRLLPGFQLFLLDSDSVNVEAFTDGPLVTVRSGSDYLGNIADYDIIIKSPGIPSSVFPPEFDFNRITSQTDLFLRKFRKQVIGVTGTKGKSTTVSLIHHIFQASGRHAVLVGNIGIPPFSRLEEIRDDTIIVMELSSHQLEYIHAAPQIALLLNIFQEHLDHYASYADYQQAKFNIGEKQEPSDFLIYNADNEVLSNRIAGNPSYSQNVLPYSTSGNHTTGIYVKEHYIYFSKIGSDQLIAEIRDGIQLQGNHNLGNMMAASAACRIAGIDAEHISSALETFKGLPHRMEYAGTVNGILYYNDSIATIPQATIEAVKTLKDIDTLILGGFDRGIDYSVLIEFLTVAGIPNLIFTGPAGKRMLDGLRARNYEGTTYLVKQFSEIPALAASVTKPGRICLLSPSASSYDEFDNFEERGNYFKKNVGLLPHMYS